MNNKLNKLFIITVSFFLFLISPKVQAQMNWVPMTSNIPDDPSGTLLGISGESKSDVFAVGMGGIIRHYDGNPDKKWEIITSPTSNNLNAVWGGSKSGVYAAGDGGTILFGYKGVHWSLMTTPVNVKLNGIWGSPEGHIFAAGANGTILYYDGDGNNDGNHDSIWEEMDSGVTEELNDIWGTASDNVFAVGAKGKVRHFDGDGNNDDKLDFIWEEIISPRNVNLKSVWGATGNILFVVGEAGNIFSTDQVGKGWDSQSFGLKDLHGVWGVSPGTIFAVGDAGTVLHYNYKKDKWKEKQKPANRQLNAVWVSQNTHVFVVGEGGIIYRAELEGSYWVEGFIYNACSQNGPGISGAKMCEAGSSQNCGTTNTSGYYGPIKFDQTAPPTRTLQFSAPATSSKTYITAERTVGLLLHCSIANNTFLFTDPGFENSIAGVVSHVCDSYNWPLKDITVKLYMADGCTFPPYSTHSTKTDERGFYNFVDLLDGIYKIVLEDDESECTFTPVFDYVATLPHESAQAYDFIGTGTGVCQCPVQSEVPIECDPDPRK